MYVHQNCERFILVPVILQSGEFFCPLGGKMNVNPASYILIHYRIILNY